MQRTPFHFRPMDELTETYLDVEMALRDTGEVVDGWLSTTNGFRTFWSRSYSNDGLPVQIDPFGWRHKPTPDVIAAWRTQQVAA